MKWNTRILGALGALVLSAACQHARVIDEYAWTVDCPDAVIHVAFTSKETRSVRETHVVSGCGLVMRIESECSRRSCSSRDLTATRLARPQYLVSTDRRVWTERGLKGPPAAPPASALPPKLITDITVAPYAPRLPRELNQKGIALKALFEVCVTARGVVSQITVRNSISPAVDASWIANIENWRYHYLIKDGQAVPWCAPLPIEVMGSG